MQNVGASIQISQEPHEPHKLLCNYAPTHVCVTKILLRRLNYLAAEVTWQLLHPPYTNVECAKMRITKKKKISHSFCSECQWNRLRHVRFHRCCYFTDNKIDSSVNSHWISVFRFLSASTYQHKFQCARAYDQQCINRTIYEQSCIPHEPTSIQYEMEYLHHRFPLSQMETTKFQNQSIQTSYMFVGACETKHRFSSNVHLFHSMPRSKYVRFSHTIRLNFVLC